MPAATAISAAVEGALDEAVVGRLIRHVGGTLATVYGKNGKPFLRDRIAGYNNAARHAPWIVLVDLDADDHCAPPVQAQWLPDPAPRMCFRLAVRSVEAWFMADAEPLADFIRVARHRVPRAPETLAHPKQSMINLARLSRRRDIRRDPVPRPASGRTEGPAYTSRLIEYATDHWRPDVAAALGRQPETRHRLSPEVECRQYVMRDDSMHAVKAHEVERCLPRAAIPARRAARGKRPYVMRWFAT